MRNTHRRTDDTSALARISSDSHDSQTGKSRTSLCPASLLFIVHGARAESAEVKDLVAFAAASGCIIQLAITAEGGDGARLAREGAALGFQTIIAVGGDGTVNDVLNGLTGTTVPLGIVPMGTANDFARQVGIPNDPREALDVILRHGPTLIDTASVNGRRFINVSTGGVGADITAETPPEIKDLLGPIAYAITGVRKLVQLEPSHMRFSGPGFDLACPTLLFAVGNARATGGGIELTPRASVTDGLLDLCIVENMPLTSLVPLLLKLRSGEHVDASGACVDGVHYVQLPTLTIEAEQSISVNLDGEEMSGAAFEYTANAQDLPVYLRHLPGELD